MHTDLIILHIVFMIATLPLAELPAVSSIYWWSIQYIIIHTIIYCLFYFCFISSSSSSSSSLILFSVYLTKCNKMMIILIQFCVVIKSILLSCSDFVETLQFLYFFTTNYLSCCFQFLLSQVCNCTNIEWGYCTVTNDSIPKKYITKIV